MASYTTKDGGNVDLVLYSSPFCPFCHKVERAAEGMNLKLETLNTVTNRGAKKELIELGGRGMVPALKIDGKIMYESDDIIDYLRTTVAV